VAGLDAVVAGLVAELREATSKLDAATAEIGRLNGIVTEQAAVIGELRDTNASLVDRVAALEKERGKDSNNSSLPPSRDGAGPRRNRAQKRAEQKAAGRNPGKQLGTPGKTSEPRTPDERVAHTPPSCSCCGHDLTRAPVVGVERRQVIDVPAVEAVVSEHVVEKRRCRCGTVTAGEFPPEATAPVVWGPGVRALAVYLMNRQHLPVERTAELLADLLGANVSTGWLCQIQQEARRRLGDFLNVVKMRLRDEPVIHADETGTRIGLEGAWVHTAASNLYTLLQVHPKRGREAMEQIGILPGYSGTIVHDGLTAYDHLDTAAHQQCGAHVIRTCRAVGEVAAYAQWTSDMIEILIAAAAAAEHAADNGLAEVPAAQAKKLRAAYRKTVRAAFASLPSGPPPKRRHTGGWTTYQRDAWNLTHRLDTEQADILRFLTDTRIPMTNNAGERSFRMWKTHDKVSGSFRSRNGADAFAAVRSYLQTAAAHDLHPLHALRQIFTPTGPWLPPPRPS
jgi:transposase